MKFGGYIGITLSVRLSVKSKLNLDYNFLIKGGKAFILHMYDPYDKIFLSIPKVLTLAFGLLLKKLNLDFNFLSKGDRAFILQIGIPYGKTFRSVPKFFNSWP